MYTREEKLKEENAADPLKLLAGEMIYLAADSNHLVGRKDVSL